MMMVGDMIHLKQQLLLFKHGMEQENQKDG
jgi:hypothetical protein